MNRQSTKSVAHTIHINGTYAIALVIVWFIFNQIVAGIAAAILVVMIIISGVIETSFS